MPNRELRFWFCLPVSSFAAGLEMPIAMGRVVVEATAMDVERIYDSKRCSVALAARTNAAWATRGGAEHGM